MHFYPSILSFSKGCEPGYAGIIRIQSTNTHRCVKLFILLRITMDIAANSHTSVDFYKKTYVNFISMI